MCIYVHYMYDTSLIHLGISYLIATAATCSNYIQQFSTASSLDPVLPWNSCLCLMALQLVSSLKVAR